MAANLVAMRETAVTEYVHDDPIWRDRANFIIAAEVSEGQDEWEQLWARSVGERQYELCCIPFFLYDLALGDVVETDSRYNVQRVVNPSGRYTFRAWLADATVSADLVIARLEQSGALVERSSANLVAIDAPDEDHARRVAEVLDALERDAGVTYETGRTE